MFLDLLVLAGLAFAGLLGALSGAAAQGVRLVAVATAGLLARPAGAFVTGALVEKTPLPEPLAGPLATSIAFVCVYVLVHFAGRALVRGLTKDREVKAVDRSAGALFGALQGAAIAWVVLSVLVGMEAKIGLRLGGEGSFTASLAKDHNFFAALRQVDEEPKPAPSSSKPKPKEQAVVTPEG